MNQAALRRWHAYLGLFMAPSVLFFALTGALQVFNLHEAHEGYHPPALLQKLSNVHTDQVFEQPHDHHADDDTQTKPGEPPTAASEPKEESATGTATLALKWFFAFVSVGLSVSTLIGIWMGMTQIRQRLTVWTLLLAGALIPVLLLLA
jgi:hypothetical protein